MRQKYRLSEDGMERLTKTLAKMAQEGIDDSADGLQSGTITTNFVKSMTKVKGMEDVIERNVQLSKTYQGFLNLYGFDTIYDMYLYARSCDVYPDEIFKSNVDALTMPIQKEIIRNGKLQEVTVYEVVYKAADPKKKAAPKKEEEEIEIRHAREFRSKMSEDNDSKDPSKVAKLKAATEKLTGSKPFNDKSHHYLSLTHNNGRHVAVIGYSTNGEHMTMDFYRTNGQTSGVAARGFAELVRLAIQKQKGVKVEDHPGARAVYTQFGLEQEDNHWVASYDELKAHMGEYPGSE